MNCTKESIWFNFIPKLAILFLFVLCLAENGISQGNAADGTWQINLEVDNYFSIKNAWSSDEKTASVVVYDSNEVKHYALSFITLKDEWNAFNFPEDFIALSEVAKTEGLSHQNLIFEVRVKRNIELRESFYFDPSPNAWLQLERYTFQEKVDSTFIWGDLIDAYKWEDKKGENVVIRSELLVNSMSEDSIVSFTKYLYFYHFLTEENSFKLLRKFSDVYEGCDGPPNGGFDLASIELTDIDRDTIGEISTLYDLYCTGNDTTNYRSKLLLSSDGKKFMLDAEINPCAEESQRIVGFSKSFGFKHYPYLLRHMQSRMGNYHQP